MFFSSFSSLRRLSCIRFPFHFSIICFVSFTLNDLPFILIMNTLYVSLSTKAAVNNVSPKISLQRSNERFVVIMVDLLPQRSERWLKSSSAPSLSKETYPNSSHITRSNFSNLFSSVRKVFCDLHSRICVSNLDIVVKSTLYPS